MIDIKLFQIDPKLSLDSQLVVYDEIYKAGAIRCFSISTKIDEERGNHSHLFSHQWFVVMAGTITIEVFDGENRLKYVLTKTNEVLFVPAGIWSKQLYSENSNLLVFTNTPYEETDYIRSLSNFMKWKSE